MKLLNVITAIDQRLTKSAQTVTLFDNKLKNFANNLIYTMRKKEGCGLASIQVEDELLFELEEYDNYRAQPNIIVIEFNKKLIVAVNPKILFYSKETTFDNEGCLSIPGEKNFALVERSTEIKVEYNLINGNKVIEELNGFIARIFQHEYDHNIGIIFPNRLEKAKESYFWNQYKSR